MPQPSSPPPFEPQGPLPAPVQQLFDAASIRAHPTLEINQDDLELLLDSDNADEQVAAHLYLATIAMQSIDLPTAEQRLNEANRLIDEVGFDRLRWWHLHTLGSFNFLTGSPQDAVDVLVEAIDIAEAGYLTEADWERSVSNRMYVLRSLGQGTQAAEELLAFVRGRRTTTLGPHFYQAVADALQWLGEYELAYEVRSQARSGDGLARGHRLRDHRELALSCLALGRFDEAAENLEAAERLALEGATNEERSLNASVSAAVSAARGDLDTAITHLYAARELDQHRGHNAEAAVAVGKLLVENQDFNQLRDVLDFVDLDAVRSDTRAQLLDLVAALLEHDGRLEEALDCLAEARRIEQQRRPLARLMSQIRSEVDPWVKGPTSDRTANVERARARRIRWMEASARDIRRSLAPLMLSFGSDISDQRRAELLSEAVDELTLIGQFLLDTRDFEDTSSFSDFWQLHPTLVSLANRAGASLDFSPAPSSPIDLGLPGFAGRVMAGLAALSLDNAGPDTTVRIEIQPEALRLVVSGLSPTAVQLLVSDVRELRTQSPSPGVPVPRRASFISTIDRAIALHWELGALAASHDSVNITVGLTTEVHQRVWPGDPEPPQPGSSQESTSQPTRPQWDDHDLPPAHAAVVDELSTIHERRLMGARPNLELIDVAQGLGHRALEASALLVNAGAALLGEEVALFGSLMQRLEGLLDSNPSLRRSIWPDQSTYFNRRAIYARSIGDYEATWIADSGAVTIEARRFGSTRLLRTAWYNWTQIEFDRGVLDSTWRASELAGTSDSSPLGWAHGGGILRRGVHVQVLLAEGQLEEAKLVGADRIAQARRFDFASLYDALYYQTVTLMRLGEHDEAERLLDEAETVEHFRGTTIGRGQATRAKLALARGDHAAARQLANQARDETIPGLNALALSVLIPVEAELLLANGDTHGAQAKLDSFPVESHRLLDLEDRFDVADRVAKQLADHATRISIARRRLRLSRGEPRFAVEHLPAYASTWEAFDRISRLETERLATERSRIGGVVSHDLNNAMATIQLGAELQDLIPANKHATFLLETVNSIALLADRLGAVALAGETDVQTVPHVVDVAEFMNGIVAPIASQLQSSGGHIDVKLDVPDTAKFETDRAMFGIVVNNLLWNAVHHGPPDVRIEFSAKMLDARGNSAYRPAIGFTIADDGPGLGPDPKGLFAELVRGETSRGLGLGLSIVGRYCESLGIDLHVDHSRHGGAQFELAVPAGEVVQAQSEASRPDEVDPVTEPEMARTNQATLVDHTVLIVEDDDRLRELMGDLLNAAGYTTITAGTTKQAWTAVATTTIDSIVSDIDLADGTTGYELLGNVLELDNPPFFVFASGHDESRIRSEVTRRYNTEVPILRKSFTAQALLDILNTHAQTLHRR